MFNKKHLVAVAIISVLLANPCMAEAPSHRAARIAAATAAVQSNGIPDLDGIAACLAKNGHRTEGNWQATAQGFQIQEKEGVGDIILLWNGDIVRRGFWGGKKKIGTWK